MANKEEIAQIVAYVEANHITPIRQGTTCPFYLGGECAIYPVRPVICQLFGHSPKMVCCRGYNVNIPQKREQKIMEEYQSTNADLWLHSFVYTDDEFLGVLQDRVEGASHA